MNNTLYFTVIISLLYFNTLALANSCVEWYAHKANYDQILESVHEGDRADVLSLINYEQQRVSVEIQISSGNRIPIQGQISNLRIENGNVKFNVGDNIIDLLNVDRISRLGIASTPEQIIEQVNPSYRDTVRKLLEAQQEDGFVEINFARGVFGSERGRVSNLRIEDGQTRFDFNGKSFKYNLSNIGEVRPLVVNTNPHQILEQVRTEKREIAETLMSTQQQNGSVEITFTNGIAGRIRGSVSNFRIEDGQAVFEIGGQTHRLFNVGKVRPLAVTRDAKQILEQVNTADREKAQLLLNSQQKALRIEIKFASGIAGRIRGSVSNFRIEDGQAVFEIGGQTHSLFNVGKIRPLAVTRDAKQILEQVNTADREKAQLLLNSQQKALRIEIKFASGIAGRIRGSVSNFRIEDGQAVFEIGGQTHSLFNVGEISPIE